MRLNQAALETVHHWLRARIDNHVCQTCGNTTWAVGDVWQLPSVGMVPDSSAISAMPVVVVQCANCACIKLFNPVSMGVDLNEQTETVSAAVCPRR